MADDKSKSGGQDRKRINLNEDYEARDWAAKFGVTPEQLRQAVAKVGNQAEDVERHLKGGKRCLRRVDAGRPCAPCDLPRCSHGQGSPDDPARAGRRAAGTCGCQTGS